MSYYPAIVQKGIGGKKANQVAAAALEARPGNLQDLTFTLVKGSTAKHVQDGDASAVILNTSTAFRAIPSPTRARPSRGGGGRCGARGFCKRGPGAGSHDDSYLDEGLGLAADVARADGPAGQQRSRSLRDLAVPNSAFGCGLADQSNFAQKCGGDDARCAEQWEVDPAEIHMGERVGVGTSAEVFRAVLHGTDVACKRMHAAMPTEFQRELSVFMQMRHPNLVLFMCASFSPQHPMIVSELCEGGSLFQTLHQQKELTMSDAQRWKIAIDTAKGMTFLHGRRTIHRDLKSLNLLLAGKLCCSKDVPWIKISDFGLSRRLPPKSCDASSLMTGGVCTTRWMAPEVLRGRGYDEKADVYSYGVVLYELLSRRVPFDDSDLENVNVAVAVCAGRRPDLTFISRERPQQLRTCMEQCWAEEAADRPAFCVVLESLKSASSS
jgi:hypothetical protein